MTLKAFKDEMKKQGYEDKRVSIVIRRLGAFELITSIGVGIIALHFINSTMFFVSILLGMILFVTTLDAVAEDEEVMKKAEKYCRYWWLSFIIVLIALLISLFL